MSDVFKRRIQGGGSQRGPGVRGDLLLFVYTVESESSFKFLGVELLSCQRIIRGISSEMGGLISIRNGVLQRGIQSDEFFKAKQRLHTSPLL